MKCPSCGAEAKGKYCEYCGSEMPKENVVINITNNYYGGTEKQQSNKACAAEQHPRQTLLTLFQKAQTSGFDFLFGFHRVSPPKINHINLLYAVSPAESMDRLLKKAGRSKRSAPTIKFATHSSATVPVLLPCRRTMAERQLPESHRRARLPAHRWGNGRPDTGG